MPKPSEEEEARQRRFSGEPIPTPVHGTRELQEIVLKACAYDPKDRFRDPSEMRDALLRLTAGEEIVSQDEKTVGVFRPRTAPIPEKEPEEESTKESEKEPKPVVDKMTECTQSIQNTDTDKKDVKGSTFAPLLLKATGKSKSVKLTWKKVKKADGYIIYGAQCGKKLKEIKKLGASKKTYTHKKLKKAKYYKYMVVAYKKEKGKKVPIAMSTTVHVPTKGGKYEAPTKVKVKDKTITLKKGKTKSIKASLVLPKGKKSKTHVAKFRYESTNKKIVTVSKKGKLKAKKKGTAYIYVYAQNGVYIKVKVKVK
jgi:hypothetical protein